MIFKLSRRENCLSALTVYKCSDKNILEVHLLTHTGENKVSVVKKNTTKENISNSGKQKHNNSKSEISEDEDISFKCNECDYASTSQT